MKDEVRGSHIGRHTPPEERKILDQIREIIAEGLGNKHGYSFKKVDKKRLEEETKKVNKAIRHVATRDITESNNLIKAASIWVARQFGLKRAIRGKKVEPWWKRRIEEDIKRISREVNILEREKRGEIKSKRKVKELENKYCIKRKGLTLVI